MRGRPDEGGGASGGVICAGGCFKARISDLLSGVWGWWVLTSVRPARRSRRRL